jgi:hypothetical protein
MQQLALLMIVSVTIVPYLTGGDKWGRMAILPGFAKYVPELLGAAALLIVIALGIRDRFRFIRPVYWVIFGLLTLCLIASAFANKLDPGPLFSGLRVYLRAMPWFLLPAVAAFGENGVRKQLKWMLGISVLQLPIAIEQRIHTANNYYGFVADTGDWTTGTLIFSGDLSLFLVPVACVIAALTLKRQLPKWQGFVLAAATLAPTMINETKVTLIVLPTALFITFQAVSKRGERLKQMVLAIVVLGVFLAAFVPIYDWVQDNQAGHGLVDFFSSDRASSYLDTDSKIGTTEHVGRLDSVRVAAAETVTDPVRAVLGLGIGNTMDSALGPQFSGKYFERYRLFTAETAFSTLLLELGFLGVGALLCVYWQIFRDALFVAEHGNPYVSALAAAWVGITPMMALALLYSPIHASVALSFLFWYFSGLVAAERMRLSVPTTAPSPARVAAERHDTARGRRAHA